ncbi:hypothetical protein [Frigoribacterium endophyticum]|jgi:hypothetical protein|uniref:hypothetical protein n=1 Tax=Frigoribacterium endophyticum TaxID=1522176 RepID=UPI0014201913|nr:hypothetical protein [Frigoribacterium endophyticum]NII50873.1 hypothetical protein [Frigoribacterium endophyticum]
MSTAAVSPIPQPARAPRRAPVEIVTTRAQRRARPRIAYALVATAALFVLLLGQLAISIALSDGAYTISDLQAEKAELTRDQQKYSEQLDVLSSPQNVANNAERLGMVRNSNPVYLDPATGAVHGVPAPADGAADGTDNLIPNTLLDGVPLVTQPPAGVPAETADGAAAGSSPVDPTAAAGTAAAAAADSAAPGAAGAQNADASVASAPNQLAAPETR